MTGILISALSCGRCGSDLGAFDPFCTRCAATVEPAADARAALAGNLLQNTLAAGSRQKLTADLIDLAPLGALGLLVVVFFLLGAPDLTAGLAATALATVLVLGYGSIHLWLLGSRGSSLGRALTRLRTVDELTATALSTRGLLGRTTTGRWLHGTVTLDLRRGRDPLTPAYRPLTADRLRSAATQEPGAGLGHQAPAFAQASPLTLPQPSGAAPPAAPTSRRGIRSAGTPVSAADLEHTVLRDQLPPGPGFAAAVLTAALVLDTGQHVPVDGAVLIGRNPDADPTAPRQSVFAWPDLSRTLSKTHALLDWDGQNLWVTDLGSTNGTTLVDPNGGERPVSPGERTTVPPGWRVSPGDRSLGFVTAGQVRS